MTVNYDRKTLIVQATDLNVTKISYDATYITAHEGN